MAAQPMSETSEQPEKKQILPYLVVFCLVS